MNTKPWYREPWLWFILAPLMVVIAACAVMVTIAFTQKDDPVMDNYYQEGKMIDRRFSAEARAGELGIVANLVFDAVSGELWVSLRGEQVEQASSGMQLHVFISHPIKAEQDLVLDLRGLGDARYRADMDMPLTGRRYIRLVAVDSATDSRTELWRLSGEIDFSQNSTVDLYP